MPYWEEVCQDLQKLLEKESTDILSISTFSLWRLVKDTLLTDRVHLRQVIQATKEVLSEIQEMETKASLCSEAGSDDDIHERKVKETKGAYGRKYVSKR